MFSQKKSFSSYLLAFLAGAAFIGVFTQGHVSDYLSAAQYNVSPKMGTIVENISLTDPADLVFKASHPTLNKTQQFNQQCGASLDRESVQILGCYTSGKIHLFEVTDERLAGMTEVTAAHELLHAMYQRLNFVEKANLKTLLKSEYEKTSKSDPAIVERMKVYAELNEDDFMNELHSVLGTEVENLSPALEGHYRTVFTDRGSVFKLFDSYTTYLKDLNDKIDDLTGKINALNVALGEEAEAYREALDSFNRDVDAFVQRNQQYEFSDNQGEFYRLRDEFTVRKSQLEQEREGLNAKVAEYNKLRDELILLDETATEIVKSMDSSFAAPKKVD